MPRYIYTIHPEVETERTYYYKASWRPDVFFNPEAITSDKPQKYSKKTRARSSAEARLKLLYSYPSLAKGQYEALMAIKARR